MDVTKRALLCLFRSWGKSLLLFCIIFIFGTTISAVLSLTNAINTTEAALRRSIVPVMTIEDNPNLSSIRSLSREEVYEISQLPEVVYLDYENWIQLISFEHARVEPITGWLTGTKSTMVYHNMDFDTYMGRGVSQSLFLDLKQGFIEISLGSTFSDGNIENGDFVLIVSSHWADYHQLNIGDIISLYFILI